VRHLWTMCHIFVLVSLHFQGCTRSILSSSSLLCWWTIFKYFFAFAMYWLAMLMFEVAQSMNVVVISAWGGSLNSILSVFVEWMKRTSLLCVSIAGLNCVRLVLFQKCISLLVIRERGMVISFSFNVLTNGSRCLSISTAYVRTLWYILNKGDVLVMPFRKRCMCAWEANDSISKNIRVSIVGVPGIVDWVIMEDASQSS